MQFENVTCPHCGLLCDDLSLDVTDLTVKLTDSSHPCAKLFESASLESNSIPTPLISGEAVTEKQALDKAAEILGNAKQPLVSGLITDVQTCREAVAITEKLGGVIDHANGKSIRHNGAVMQRIGKVKTTLAEARNRADCVIIFGSKVTEKFPRLLERVLLPKKTLGDKNVDHKKIYILDISTDGAFKIVNDKNNITQIFFDYPLLETIVYHLQEIVYKSAKDISAINENTQSLIDLYQTILDSQYTTLIWNSSEFNQDSAEHTIQAITESIKFLMQKVRCVGLPLGGSKGEVTANHVTTWQTGVPLPVSFMSGVPVHDPVRFDGMNMLANNEADSLLWIANYHSDDEPPDTKIPTIIFGHPKMKTRMKNNNASVFIPCGIPGVDHRGLACRADNVATLPLPRIRNSNLPTASVLLHKLMQLV
jgi:formylmethanofuran dehydrogenase subunit B